MNGKRLTAKSPRVKIEVTRELIEQAIPRDSGHCMIADAVLRSVPNARFISVDLATIRFTDLAAGRRYIYLTPERGQMALIDFDQGNKPEPFTIELRGAHVVATGTARRGRAELRQSKDKKYPVRVGGRAPKLGPLPGTGKTPGAEKVSRWRARNTPRPAPAADTPNARTGRRREFGLRVMIR